ncbi:MAG: hypothetical protein HWE23_01590 [Rhodobacteraceae bacterium]|nr:hypothetical protein [Paracoccaceae bacterium]
MSLSSGAKWVLSLLSIASLAIIVHILVILSIPQNATHRAYEAVALYGPDRQFNTLPEVRAGSEPLPALDPAMKHAACRFQLADGPVLFHASIPAPFWSIGVFNASGEAIYSLNNRTVGSDVLSMLLISPEQLSILRENPPEDLEDLIVIEQPIKDGFALLRAFVPSHYKSTEIETALSSAYCGWLDEASEI